ncbi:MULTISPECIES: type II secretion system protein [Cysteiniphilum]|uniref:type II secretion system protein n=1 Tax=Cysteiniphilum TaxID=2056696 RepID=UPI00177D6FF1|nr:MULTISPECIES: type II secretion system protein [Cysteiniphilum]
MTSKIMNIKQHNKLSKQRGITMVELLIVLGVIAVILGFIMVKAMGLRSNVDVGKAVDEVNMISQGVTTMYSSFGGDYSDVSDSDIVSLAPKNMLYGATDSQVVGTPWYNSNNDSTVTIKEGGNSSQYTLTLNSIPKDACRAIGSQFLNGVAAAVDVGGSAVTTVSELNTSCGTGDDADDGVDLGLTFN